MTGNHRGPAYAAVQSLLGRRMTMDERVKLDALLTAFGIPGGPHR